jgi:DNA polymerase/3'-5' exonuclease PolX
MAEGKKGKSPEFQKTPFTTSEGKEGEAEVFLSEGEVREYLGEGETMESHGKHLLLSGMSVKRAKELANAMGADMATLEDLLKAFGVDPEEAKKRVKALEASKQKGSEE